MNVDEEVKKKRTSTRKPFVRVAVMNRPLFNLFLSLVVHMEKDLADLLTRSPRSFFICVLGSCRTTSLLPCSCVVSSKGQDR